MRDGGLEYARAHEIASELEYDLRNGVGLTPQLARGGKKIAKADLVRLPDPAIYEYVQEHYRHRRGKR